MNKETINEVKKATHGIITVSGEMGVGKTSFALEYPANPKKIAFFNFDEKPLGGIESSLYSYNSYFHMLADISDDKKSKEKAEDVMLQSFFNDVKKLTEGKNKPEVIIIDSAERLFGAFLPYVMRNASKMKKFAGSGTWEAKSKIGYAKVFSTAFFSKLREDTGATIILIAHLGNKYVDEIAVGKTPALNEIVKQKSLLSIWLMHNEHSPVPNGLVTKRISKSIATPSGFRTEPVLPAKLSIDALPNREELDHVSLWDVIFHYWEYPIGLNEPEDYEKLNEEEFALISSTLTETQRHTLAVKANSSGEMGDIDIELVTDVIRDNLDKPLPMIKKAIKEFFGDWDVPISQIKTIKETLES